MPFVDGLKFGSSNTLFLFRSCSYVARKYVSLPFDKLQSVALDDDMMQLLCLIETQLGIVVLVHH